MTQTENFKKIAVATGFSASTVRNYFKNLKISPEAKQIIERHLAETQVRPEKIVEERPTIVRIEPIPYTVEENETIVETDIFPKEQPVEEVKPVELSWWGKFKALFK